MEQWIYDPATERWHVTRDGSHAECVLIPLEDRDGKPFTSRGGYNLGYCVTHDTTEWIKLEAPVE